MHACELKQRLVKKETRVFSTGKGSQERLPPTDDIFHSQPVCALGEMGTPGLGERVESGIVALGHSREQQLGLNQSETFNFFFSLFPSPASEDLQFVFKLEAIVKNHCLYLP